MITASIISAILSIAATAITAGVQSKQLKEGQEEAKILAGRQEAESSKRWGAEMNLAKQNAALNKAQLAEQQRQFDVQTGVAKEGMAYDRLKSRFGTIAGVLSKNKELEDIFINRVKGMRG